MVEVISGGREAKQPFCVSLQPPRPVRLVQYWHFVVPRWCEQSTQAPGPHPDSTAQGPLLALQRQPQSERLFSPGALEKEPTNHSSQKQSPACGMCMPNLPPPCHRSRHRPISAQHWPLNCWRLASCWGERRSQRSCLHALLRPLRPITNRNPIGSSISASAAPLRLA